MKFSELESSFILFMIENGPKEKNSKSNYRSWLHYIEEHYGDISELSEQKIKIIIDDLKTNASVREKYNKKTDIASFKSALHKFYEFTKSGDSENPFNEITSFFPTDKRQIILSRLGQGKFRKDLIKMFNGICFITGFNKTELLVASHIKPWKVSSDMERLDPYNGLLLIPNYDKLFDKGYISFNPISFKMEIAKSLSSEDLSILNIKKNSIMVFTPNQLKYIKYHYEEVFMK